jgi:hypothetical protein
MKKWWLAFWAAAALSMGIAWAEGTHDKTKAECGKDGTTACCCCCAKSCPK